MEVLMFPIGKILEVKRRLSISAFTHHAFAGSLCTFVGEVKSATKLWAEVKILNPTPEQGLHLIDGETGTALVEPNDLQAWPGPLEMEWFIASWTPWGHDEPCLEGPFLRWEDALDFLSDVPFKDSAVVTVMEYRVRHKAEPVEEVAA
jgi:hypothetical protein